MKKLNISEKQVSFFFLFALFYLIVTSLISMVGHHWGFISYNDTFDTLRNNILMYVLLPFAVLVKVLQLVGVLPQNKPVEDIYIQENNPQAYKFIKYGKMALGAAALIIVLLVVADKRF